MCIINKINKKQGKYEILKNCHILLNPIHSLFKAEWLIIKICVVFLIHVSKPTQDLKGLA